MILSTAVHEKPKKVERRSRIRRNLGTGKRGGSEVEEELKRRRGLSLKRRRRIKRKRR